VNHDESLKSVITLGFWFEYSTKWDNGHVRWNGNRKTAASSDKGTKILERRDG
jgi:hypothetical protein